MSFKICLVEDEKNLNQLLTTYLRNEDWIVMPAFTGKEAMSLMQEKPHLWILDIMLPDIDGYQLIEEIKRNTPQIPVIFISARDADLDRIIGLEKGSDDYLAKPFLPKELVIRTKKLLERIYVNNTTAEKENTITISPYLINKEKRAVSENNNPIDLTSKEFDFLLLFSLNLGKAFSRDDILRKLWGDDYFGTDRVVDDLIRRLRKKMPRLNLETIYGYGYRMV